MELETKAILPIIGSVLMIASFFIGPILKILWKVGTLTAATFTLKGNGKILWETGGVEMELDWSYAYLRFVVMGLAGLCILIAILIMIGSLGKDTGKKLLNGLSGLTFLVWILFVGFFFIGMGTVSPPFGILDRLGDIYNYYSTGGATIGFGIGNGLIVFLVGYILNAIGSKIM